MLVKIKWNKQVFDEVEIDPSAGVEIFKSQVYSLTGTVIGEPFICRPNIFSRSTNGPTEVDG